MYDSKSNAASSAELVGTWIGGSGWVGYLDSGCQVQPRNRTLKLRWFPTICSSKFGFKIFDSRHINVSKSARFCIFFFVAWRPSKTAILCAFNKQYSENYLEFSAKRLVENAITIYFALFVELTLLFSL